MLVIAIFCLPNEGFAQYWEGANYSETIDPSQGAMASTWFIGKYGGTDGFNWNSKQKKPRKTTTPITKESLGDTRHCLVKQVNQLNLCT